MKCKLCSSDVISGFSSTVRGKYKANYVICPECDFMFVDNPTWLNEAYKDPINITDVGYVTRNVFMSRKILLLCFFIFGKKKTYLDYAAGYGMLGRLMRDYGIDFLWDDPYTVNLFTRGFEYDAQKNKEIEAITCLECFEHLENPTEEINKMLTISDSVIFSTRLKPVDSIPDLDWPYYGFEHGQHVSFYSEKSLSYLAKKNNLNFYTDNDNFHILTKKKLSKKILKVINILTKLQLDIVIRKILKSKTTEDHEKMIGIVNKNNT